MSWTNETLAVAASKRLKMDGRSILTLMSFVSNALNNLARQTANDSLKKFYLMSDPDSTTVAITADAFNNVADLSSLMDSPQVMIDNLQYGTVFYGPPINTFTQYNLITSITVANSGTAAMNGVYTSRGSSSGHFYYNLTGEDDSTTLSAVVYPWTISDSSGVVRYSDVEITPSVYPWLDTYESASPSYDPPPTVTGSTDATQVRITSHGYQTGNAVRFSGISGKISGVSESTTYYVIVVDSNTVSFATSLANAFAGTALTLTGEGDGTVTITPYGRTVAQWLQSPNQASLTQAVPFDYTYI